MQMLLHQFGDTTFLPKSAYYFRVETWRGHYVATYSTEFEAQRHAATIKDRYDAKVVKLSRAA